MEETIETKSIERLKEVAAKLRTEADLLEKEIIEAEKKNNEIKVGDWVEPIISDSQNARQIESDAK